MCSVVSGARSPMKSLSSPRMWWSWGEGCWWTDQVTPYLGFTSVRKKTEFFDKSSKSIDILPGFNRSEAPPPTQKKIYIHIIYPLYTPLQRTFRELAEGRVVPSVLSGGTQELRVLVHFCCVNLYCGIIEGSDTLQYGQHMIWYFYCGYNGSDTYTSIRSIYAVVE